MCKTCNFYSERQSRVESTHWQKCLSGEWIEEESFLKFIKHINRIGLVTPKPKYWLHTTHRPGFSLNTTWVLLRSKGNPFILWIKASAFKILGDFLWKVDTENQSCLLLKLYGVSLQAKQMSQPPCERKRTGNRDRQVGRTSMFLGDEWLVSV